MYGSHQFFDQLSATEVLSVISKKVHQFRQDKNRLFGKREPISDCIASIAKAQADVAASALWLILHCPFETLVYLLAETDFGKDQDGDIKTEMVYLSACLNNETLPWDDANAKSYYQLRHAFKVDKAIERQFIQRSAIPFLRSMMSAMAIDIVHRSRSEKQGRCADQPLTNLVEDEVNPGRTGESLADQQKAITQISLDLT